MSRCGHNECNGTCLLDPAAWGPLDSASVGVDAAAIGAALMMTRRQRIAADEAVARAAARRDDWARREAELRERLLVAMEAQGCRELVVAGGTRIVHVQSRTRADGHGGLELLSAPSVRVLDREAVEPQVSLFGARR